MYDMRVSMYNNPKVKIETQNPSKQNSDVLFFSLGWLLRDMSIFTLLTGAKLA